VLLRVAAIDFLNPAPLMWDFDHPPRAEELRSRYLLRLTAPSQCAADLLANRADLGLIPVAALTPELRIVPGCTIASLDQVRSIQLVVKAPLSLGQVRTVAADTASRSSIAYAELMLRLYFGAEPAFHPAPADPLAMLQYADAALLIGDPALLALEQREAIERAVGPCTWHDIAALWQSQTGMPWVAAVWAVRPQAVPTASARQRLIADLNQSREHGLANVETLVREWTPRIAVPAETIRTYLTRNIHYTLDPACEEAILLFRRLAVESGILPPLPELHFLEP
jgi:chorismate dehydratase